MICYDPEECAMRDCVQCPKYNEQPLSDLTPKAKKCAVDNIHPSDTKTEDDLSNLFE